jgi:very-short-patch-repair endonuclease
VSADLLKLHLQSEKIPFEQEYRFHDSRRWRADFAFPQRKLLVEVDGAIWTGGRHTRGAGWEKDAEKLNAAAILGYRVLRFSPGMVRRGEAIETIKRCLEAY